jgi:nitrous oxidase accessory protein NosD
VVSTLLLLAALTGSAQARSVTLADATNGLAAAIRQAGPGGTVYLKGVIREDESIEIPDRVNLRGANVRGKGPTLIITPTDRLNALIVLGSDVEIANVTIQPPSELYGNLGTGIFVLGSRFELRDSTLIGWRIGLFFSGADSGKVIGNQFSASKLNLDPDHLGAGVFAQFSSGQVKMWSNRFHAHHVGVYVQDSSGYEVYNNDLEKNDIGIWMDGATDSGVYSNIVAGSLIAGILLTEGATDVMARSNGVGGSAGDSMIAEVGTSGNTLRGNRTDKPIRDLGKNTLKDNQVDKKLRSGPTRDRDRDDDDDDDDDD